MYLLRFLHFHISVIQQTRPKRIVTDKLNDASAKFYSASEQVPVYDVTVSKRTGKIQQTFTASYEVVNSFTRRDHKLYLTISLTFQMYLLTCTQ